MRFSTKTSQWTAAIAAALALVLASTLIPGQPASASARNVESLSLSSVSGAGFNAGMIISDQVFFYPGAMDAAGIQNFLNSKVTTCASGATCLKNYHQDTYSIPADPMCSAITGKANQSAAQIVYDVAQACDINPQVILVTLQKEQGLVTASRPIINAYRSAMGAGCPDTAACDANYYGFFNQVHYGTYLMKRYTQPAGTGPGTAYYSDFAAPYRVGATVPVKYSPNCAGPAITIQNMATHVLYVYTPYQPEPQVLSGTVTPGDLCAAYGNYNFWSYFTSWFGSTTILPAAESYVTAAYSDVLGRTPGQSELTYWSLAMSQGMSRQTVANAFNNSDEYRNLRIGQAYQAAFGRAPDAAGQAYWLSLMQRGVVQPDDAYRTFLASQELYDGQGGGAPAGYITAVYQQILHRAPDAGGLAYWTALLGAGVARSAVSESLWLAPETFNVRVNDTYLLLLGRAAGDAEQQYWSGFSRAYGPTAFRAAIMASDEYWVRSQGRFPF